MPSCHIKNLARFEALTQRLEATRDLWQPRPFVDLPVPWEAEYPKISASLRALSKEQVNGLRSNISQIKNVSDDLNEIEICNGNLAHWPSLHGGRALIDAKRNPVRVSGRKWKQIAAFASVVIPRMSSSVNRWLDWCSGKGHLGRAMGELAGIDALFVEKNPQLCGPGFVKADVLEDDLVHLFEEGTGVIALHACGILNARLLTQAVNSNCGFLAFAPCCYQKIDGDQYQPLSKAAKASSFRPNRQHMRLVSFEEVVAGRGEKKRRSNDHAYRLGFDLLARQVTGTDRYRPLGQLPPSFFSGTFEHFAIETAKKEKITLPAKWDAVFYEKEGKKRWETNRALSLVRAMFARCFESWLLLDRILFLEEQGWMVEAGTFCETTVTPRNLIIVAKR